MSYSIRKARLADKSATEKLKKIGLRLRAGESEEVKASVGENIDIICIKMRKNL
ncbi:MAG TPA: hypothetical protein VNB22_24725 [Pyrinomonadaceae bacterium]|nr:hypothetical protein [Pyrinomonadaceae bacterium]